MPQKPTEKKPGAPAPAAAEYSAQELIAAARSAFGVSPDIMAAALKTAGLTRATKAKARELAENFAKREVK